MYRAERSIENTGSRLLKVCIEPWALVIAIPPGKTYTFVAESEFPGELELVSGTGITLFAWLGCDIAVLDGDRVVERSEVRVPETPEGMAVEGLLSGVLSLGDLTSVLD